MNGDKAVLMLERQHQAYTQQCTPTHTHVHTEECSNQHSQSKAVHASAN